MTHTRTDGPVSECDVLVVGGGANGLFLATLLAQRGMDVTVLERRTEPSTHSRAIGLHPPALAALRRVGLDQAALDQGLRIRRGAARSRGRELGVLTFERASADFPFVLALPQHRTEALLTRRLEELAPGALRRGWEVTGVHEADNCVRVIAAGPPGADVTWRARVLVGADGARSLIRSRVGIASRPANYPDTYLMGDFEDTTGTEGTAGIYLEAGGVVESFPLPGGSRRWVAHTGRALREASASALTTMIRERTGAAPDAASNTMVSAFGVRRRLVRRMVARRTVLAGDAAHEISPIGGQSITLGWLDALALAPLLERLVTDDPGCPLSEMAPFRAFERSRLRAARIAAHVAHLNMILGRPVPGPLRRLRDAALTSVLSGPSKHWVAGAYTMGWAAGQRRGVR